MFLLFLVQQRVSRAMFEVFDVYPHQVAGTDVLTSDVNVELSSTDWKVGSVFAGVGILLYAIGIPLTGVAVLYHHRDRLHDRLVVMKFGFIFDGYDVEEFYWWEVVVVLRRHDAAAASPPLFSLITREASDVGRPFEGSPRTLQPNV